MIKSSQTCFRVFENKEFFTKQNDQAIQPHTQKLQIQQTFSQFLNTSVCELHPTLLCGLGIKLTVL